MREQPRHDVPGHLDPQVHAGAAAGDAVPPALERRHEQLAKAIDEVAALREAFWEDLIVPGAGDELNQELERAGRVADFLELGELMCRDALERDESCGCHFRVEHQTPDHEALRDDEHFAYAAAWDFSGGLRKEPLTFQNVHPSQRSYK